MYIQDIVIDGFKSYANRTVIEGFDPTFNAITGLNGSGKSNILDSICFVLGISNLSQVRVDSLQELVYKKGQAGIVKASVTITFNNSDKKQSPAGYEHYDVITVTRQVAIAGRNKYLINGHTAQLSRVQDLFHSVQLNVNNPHFLIMQGRITKVLNMKPPEILSMIEEAAGTRMFEVKKRQALVTIEKKQTKVDDINKILAEEITPTLEKLRAERTSYMKFTNNQTNIDRLQRFITAYEYYSNEKKMESSDLEEVKTNLENSQKRKKELTSRLSELKQKISEMVKERERESGLDEMDQKEQKLVKELVKLQTAYKNQKELLDKEENTITNIASNREEVKQGIQQKRVEKEQFEKKIESIVNENQQLNNELKQLQSRQQAMTTGITSGGEGAGEDGSYTEQLMEAKKNAVNASTTIKQAEFRIKHLNSELITKRKLVTQEQSDHKKLQQEYDNVDKEIQALLKQLESLSGNNNKQQELVEKKRQLEPQCSKLREDVGNLSAQLSGLEFSYTDPSKDFDRRKVKGIVANLVSLKDSETATALEICAGGKLYNIVVEDDNTGKALLSKGQLKRRVTLLPLNKVESRSIDPAKVKLAQKIGGADGIKPAIDLVQFDKELYPAINYVFGSTFVANDKKYAQKTAFDPNIRVRTISLEGDEYNPSGSLTGGSRPSSGSILTHIQRLNENNRKLRDCQHELESVNTELSKIRSLVDNFNQLEQQISIKKHQLHLTKQRLELNPHHQLLENIKEMENSIKTDTLLIETSKQKETESLEKVEELEANVNNFQSIREKQLKEVEKKIQALKEKCNKSNKLVKSESVVIENLDIEIQQMENELELLSKDAQGNEGEILKMRKDCEKINREIVELNKQLDHIRETLSEKRREMADKNETIRSYNHEAEKAQLELTDIEIKYTSYNAKITRYNKDRTDAAKWLEATLKKNPWIANEKKLFGKPNGDFDFKAINPERANAELIKLQEEQEKLSKSINRKVMSMFDKAEQEYQELMEKKKIIENDKRKIEQVIKELDEKKNESLRSTWKKVNKDFGSIFSTLLPGTSAKLEPPEGKTELDGLEVKVAFGDVWKESLSELSGGQKSLLALSLILSLLLFKPAPMYILDEIDAALDLSHTQNIGMMLKQHFTSSQFIVVSLKEGMFNNANVLFETKFIDGVSKVHRTVFNQSNRQSSKPKK
ncbi:hypothetical protein DICPUDRAFT_29916 [Dictyostelium purpureum]|uniref:Structural maintenance of chromosomes protein n=1 Tax=Dictyostelium purpureum TaxID=5786 RepID=F0ZEF6_DICPU|nr:uncharacterized protein DICPUDRAFT_29916 [Dictyostelium purpureum]EGC37686.1 hypothetical protein DICPUDRAFT_29916 [Dictyostelium purpureum]|eukprot:XP_003285790.1 hypothetical protein DICPUDRAFT_29916 [Dictyostelium purpureum]